SSLRHKTMTDAFRVEGRRSKERARFRKCAMPGNLSEKLWNQSTRPSISGPNSSVHSTYEPGADRPRPHFDEQGGAPVRNRIRASFSPPPPRLPGWKAVHHQTALLQSAAPTPA